MLQLKLCLIRIAVAVGDISGRSGCGGGGGAGTALSLGPIFTPSVFCQICVPGEGLFLVMDCSVVSNFAWYG